VNGALTAAAEMLYTARAIDATVTAMNDPDGTRPYTALWDAMRAHLEAERRAVMREIRTYPQPIAGCDAQIPVLWERRDAISAELARLDAAARNPSPEAVDAFLAASSVFCEADRRKFLEQAARLNSPASARPIAAE
jgi:hypothetical protein